MRTEHAARDSEGMPERSPCDGHLTPWADPVTGALGWQMLTMSRRLAVAVAGNSGIARSHVKGEWQARIPEAALTVVVTHADNGALWCRLSSRPDSGVLTVAFAPWTAATVLKYPVTAWPARGTLSVRDVRVTTRMGRTVRYLIPAFTTA